MRAAKAKGREVLLDCEHFFDGYKAKPAFALACAKAAYEEGARWVVLCDTNGGTLPHEVERIVGEVCAQIPGDHVGIHAHNDTEQAVANSFAAVRAGARQIQGTLNGLGERCGNANLVSIIPTLKLKEDMPTNSTSACRTKRCRIWRARRASRTAQPRCGSSRPLCRREPFATKAGIHASAIVKEPATYEHVAPERVGKKRKLLVSDQSGRSNVLAELERIGFAVDKDDPRVNRLLDEVKDREAIGYAYEAADASFELLARRLLGKVPHYRCGEIRRQRRQRINAKGASVTVSQAVVKIKVGDEELISVAEGVGPVNALDLALRKVSANIRSLSPGSTHRLPRAYPQWRHRGRDPRADRKLRRDRRPLDTVGVSPNIIDASSRR